LGFSFVVCTEQALGTLLCATRRYPTVAKQRNDENMVKSFVVILPTAIFVLGVALDKSEEGAPPTGSKKPDCPT
jgi:hypothetical protein